MPVIFRREKSVSICIFLSTRTLIYNECFLCDCTLSLSCLYESRIFDYLPYTRTCPWPAFSVFPFCHTFQYGVMVFFIVTYRVRHRVNYLARFSSTKSNSSSFLTISFSPFPPPPQHHISEASRTVSSFSFVVRFSPTLFNAVLHACIHVKRSLVLRSTFFEVGQLHLTRNAFLACPVLVFHFLFSDLPSSFPSVYIDLLAPFRLLYAAV